MPLILSTNPAGFWPVVSADDHVMMMDMYHAVNGGCSLVWNGTIAALELHTFNTRTKRMYFRIPDAFDAQTPDGLLAFDYLHGRWVSVEQRESGGLNSRITPLGVASVLRIDARPAKAAVRLILENVNQTTRHHAPHRISHVLAEILTHPHSVYSSRFGIKGEGEEKKTKPKGGS